MTSSRVKRSTTWSTRTYRPFYPWAYEHVLIRRLQHGDQDAEECLLDSYRRMVRTTAVQLASRHVSAGDRVPDMVVVGDMAVVVSARRFDLDRGQRTFYPYVKAAIFGAEWIEALSGFSSMHIPYSLLSEACAIRSAFAEAGAEASIEEIANLSGVPASRVEGLWSAANHAMALDDGLALSGPQSARADLNLSVLDSLEPIERDAVRVFVLEEDDAERVARRYDCEVDGLRDLAWCVAQRIVADDRNT